MPPGQSVRIRRVGSYAIGKTIGEGTFGKVRIGTHLLTHERVALKILEKSRIQSTTDMRRITREIQILKLLDHPNIVKLLEVIDTPKHIYIVMEYVEHGELFDYIVARQRVPENEACRFFHGIINGLDYCHIRGVIHRDLKPENLLIDGSGKIKIADFGLSNTITDESTMLKTACGSPCYAAPEMISGKSYDGPGVDIWSVGVVLFALLCGYLPFEDKTTALLYDKILHGRYTCPSYLSEEAKDLIGKILTVDPAKRATIADIRAHPWYTTKYDGPPEESTEGNTYHMPRRIDFRIITILEQYGFDPLRTLRSLQDNRHNQLTATYYLLAEREEMSRRRGLTPRTLKKTDTSGDGTWVFQEQNELAERLGFTIDSQGHIRTLSAASTSPATGLSESNHGAISPETAKDIIANVIIPQPDPKGRTSSEAPSKTPILVAPADSSRLTASTPEPSSVASPTPVVDARTAAQNALNAADEAICLKSNGREDGSSPETREKSPSSKNDNASVASSNNPKITKKTASCLEDTDDKPLTPAVSRTPSAKSNSHHRRQSKSQKDSTPSPNSNSQQTPAIPQTIPELERSTPAKTIMTPEVIQEEGTAESRSTPVSVPRLQLQDAGPTKAASQKTADSSLRTYRGNYSMANSTTKPPSEVVEQIIKALTRLGITWKRSTESPWQLRASDRETGVRLEVEVCRLLKVEGLYVVKFKRVLGASWDYKGVCNRVLANLSL